MTKLKIMLSNFLENCLIQISIQNSGNTIVPLNMTDNPICSLSSKATSSFYIWKTKFILLLYKLTKLSVT
jgi:hypothetical protein